MPFTLPGAEGFSRYLEDKLGGEFTVKEQDLIFGARHNIQNFTILLDGQEYGIFKKILEEHLGVTSYEYSGKLPEENDKIHTLSYSSYKGVEWKRFDLYADKDGRMYIPFPN